MICCIETGYYIPDIKDVFNSQDSLKNLSIIISILGIIKPINRVS